MAGCGTSWASPDRGHAAAGSNRRWNEALQRMQEFLEL
jgi:hypothetical protein